MSILRNIAGRARTRENLSDNISEREMWDLFSIYISDDKSLAEAFTKGGGSLGGNVGTRLQGYHRLLNYDVSNNGMGMTQLRRLIDVCWQMYDYDPLIKQGVDTRALYTFGQGVTIGCRKKGSWGTQLS